MWWASTLSSGSTSSANCSLPRLRKAELWEIPIIERFGRKHTILVPGAPEAVRRPVSWSWSIRKHRLPLLDSSSLILQYASPISAKARKGRVDSLRRMEVIGNSKFGALIRFVLMLREGSSTSLAFVVLGLSFNTTPVGRKWVTGLDTPAGALARPPPASTTVL